MNKFLLFLFSLLLGVSVKAGTPIGFTVQWAPENSIGHGYPKSPMRPPVVYIEDYTLAFVADHPEYILNIKDSVFL